MTETKAVGILFMISSIIIFYIGFKIFTIPSDPDYYELTFPDKGGEVGQILTCNLDGKCKWANPPVKDNDNE